MTKANKILITIGIIALILATIQIWRSKGNGIMQLIRGHKNVQIKGNNNIVDNRE